MVDIPFHWVDVFSDKPFRGSPAAVCIIKDELFAHQPTHRQSEIMVKVSEDGTKLTGSAV